VEAKKGGTDVSLKVAGMPQPTVLGAEFLTYVLWTVTPDGTTTNLGEVPIDKTGQGKLDVTAQSQTFALIVTAEPYYAVNIPSELVVLVNETRKNTKGKIYPDNSYKLMRRSEYTKQGNPLALTPDLKKIPLDMYEARNAVEIAKSRGAQQYAPEIFAKAQSSLQMAENALTQDSGKNQVISAARQTIQFAEDARSLAVRRETAQRIQQEKEAAAAAAAAQAKAAADAQAAAEARRQAELTAAKEGQMKAEAAAEAAQASAQQAALQAKEQAARDEAARALSSDAQLKLAKLSGIIQAHPGLNLAIEGYTDTTGTADFNMTLSQQRADTVRTFLITQGLSPDTITAKGLGESNPIADNSTPAGRKLKRPVEIIVSGSVIGVQISN
jgi:outer membrane protein OmpA-like peptidoglycan-associated protein